MVNIFEILSGAKNMYEKRLVPICAKYDVTYTEMTVLLFLANNPEYDTAADIARIRGIAKSHISMSVHSLIDKHMIVGEYFENDRRSMHLSLTSKTKKIIKDGQKAQKEFGEKLLEGLDEQEKVLFENALVKINENIQSTDNNTKEK